MQTNRCNFHPDRGWKLQRFPFVRFPLYNFGANCVEVIFNFCPTWAEVEFWTSSQLGRKSVFYSRQVVGKLAFKILSNLGRIIFLKFFRETLLKMPFSSATTWSRILKNCRRSTHKKFSFGGYHLRTTMDKMPFSPATTWKINNQPSKLRHKPP